MSCSIVRNSETKEVVKVYNEDGSESTLFQKAAAYLKNKEKALTVWATSLTDDFLKLKQPASFKNVMKFLLAKATNKDKLTNEDKIHLANNVMTTGLSSEELFDTISKTFYTNGYFELDRKRLEESELYTDVEVTNLMSNPKTQKEVQSFTERVLSFYTNNEDTSELDFIFEEVDEFTEVLDPSNLVGIGKAMQLNPIEVDAVIKSRLAGVKERETFDELVAELPYNGLVVKYMESELFADSFYAKYSEIKKVPSFFFENGVLTQKTKPATKLIDLKQTVRVFEGNQDTTDLITLLQETNVEFWDRNEEVIKDSLMQIEREFAKANLDIIGLHKLYDTNTRESMMNTLFELELISNQLKEASATEEDLQNFAEKLVKLFPTDTNNTHDFLDNTEDVKDKAIVTIENPLGDLEMYEKHSLLHVKDNVYQKVNKKSLDELTSEAIELALTNKKNVPQEMFYPTAFNANEVFEPKRLENASNLVDLYKDVKRYLTKKSYEYLQVGEGVIPLDYVMFREISEYNQNKVAKDKTSFSGFKGNVKYLTTDYIADFKEAYLQEKFKDSTLFKEVYSNFEITSQGITLTNKGEQDFEYLNKILPNNKVFNDLRQYAYLSKDRYIQRFRPTTGVVTPKALRDFYSNNPNELENFVGEYDFEDGLMYTDNIQDDFVKNPDGLFEKITQVGNVSIYRNIPVFVGNTHNIVGAIADFQGDVDVTKFSKSIEKSSTFATPINKISKTELEKIDSEMDSCK